MSETPIPRLIWFPTEPEAWDALRRSVAADLDVDEQADLDDNMEFVVTAQASHRALKAACECADLEAQREIRKAHEAVHHAIILQALLERLEPIMATADPTLRVAAALERFKLGQSSEGAQ